jgi:hypothetical protein
MPRRSDACRVCGHAFDVSEAFLVALYETPAGYDRLDRCLTCAAPAGDEPLAAWRTRRPAPATPRVRQFDRTAIYALFRRLDPGSDPRRRQLRFVLALLLWRKKVVTLDQTRPGDDGEVWEFRDPRSEETFDVIHPELDDSAAEQLSQQLEDLLADPAAEFDPTPGATPDAASEETADA